MVAFIKASGSLRNALHYNENKLSQGVANLIPEYGRNSFSNRIAKVEDAPIHTLRLLALAGANILNPWARRRCRPLAG